MHSCNSRALKLKLGVLTVVRKMWVILHMVLKMGCSLVLLLYVCCLSGVVPMLQQNSLSYQSSAQAALSFLAFIHQKWDVS